MALGVGCEEFGGGPGVVAGLVPAIHEIRRIERPKVSNKAKSFAIARPRQYETRFCGGIAWMAGTIPGSSPGTAMTRPGLKGAIGKGAAQHLAL
jgi:hypothetical protein